MGTHVCWIYVGRTLNAVSPEVVLCIGTAWPLQTEPAQLFPRRGQWKCVSVPSDAQCLDLKSMQRASSHVTFNIQIEDKRSNLRFIISEVCKTAQTMMIGETSRL